MGEPQEKMRTFKSGATRNLDQDKLDFEGFLSPRVLKRFAQYMHKHRQQADGTLRDSDNWQKGIPRDAYMKSMWRHFLDVWSAHRGCGHDEDVEESLCALMFNVQGYLHEYLKGKRVEQDTPDYRICSVMGCDQRSTCIHWSVHQYRSGSCDKPCLSREHIAHNGTCMPIRTEE